MPPWEQKAPSGEVRAIPGVGTVVTARITLLLVNSEKADEALLRVCLQGHFQRTLLSGAVGREGPQYKWAP